MIQVSVEVDIQRALRELRLERSAVDRAAYSALNDVADEVARDSAKEIASQTGMTRADVRKRMYIKGAGKGRMAASVHALASARNVGQYRAAGPRQTKAGVRIRAWGKSNLYDKAFVKNPKYRGARGQRVWRRTGKGRNSISDRVWGPSVRKTFEWPIVRARQQAVLTRRWPYHLERRLRGALGRRFGFGALAGISSVLPGLTGPQFLE